MNMQKILTELNKELTDREVGKAVGLAPNTIARLRRGVHKSTRWEFATAIITLANKHGVKVSG